jgi:hypothetical protein
VVAASLLNYFIPRLYPWGGEQLIIASPSRCDGATARRGSKA